MPRNIDREIEQAKEAVAALENEKLEQLYEGVVGSTYKHERGDVFVVKSIANLPDPLNDSIPAVPTAIGVMKRDADMPLSRLTSRAWTKR